MNEEKEKRTLPPVLWVLAGAIGMLLLLLPVLLRLKAVPTPAATEPPVFPTETAAPTPIPTPEPAPTPTPHIHIWAEANCERPATCTLCGEQQGIALGHSWVAADEQPRHCSVCGLTEGEALPRPTSAKSGETEVDLYTKDESCGKQVSVAVAHSGNLAACESCVKRLREEGYNAYLYQVPEQEGYAIAMGIYATRDEAEELVSYLKAQEKVPGVALESAYAFNVYLPASAVYKYATPRW